MNQPENQFQYCRSRDRGSAILVSLILIIYLGIMTTSLYVIQFHRNRLKGDYVSKIETVYAAEGTVSFGVERLWSQFLYWNGGETGGLTRFQDFLSITSPKILPGTWTELPMAGIELAPALTGDLLVYRKDGPDYTELRFRSSCTTRDHTQVVESVFRTQGEPYEGFDFSLLTNNVTCIFCHADFDNVKKFTGDPYQRVRVASLESMMVRSNADSNIYGTLYAMKELLLKDGTVLNDLSGIELYGRSMTDGIIDPDTTTPVVLSPAPVGADGNPEPGYNFYKDYPNDPEGQTDGSVPSDFPSIFPDENSNKTVDDFEYTVVADAADGKASGFGFVIPNGSTFGSNSLSTASTVSLDRTVEGNLVLTGTEANPIQIDGKVVVNGDVIIKGKVKGTGSIIARGNIYIAGDLTYADGESGGVRTFGTAADGTQNTLGLSSGGNILVGDYLTPKKGDVTDPGAIMTGDLDGEGGFAISQYSLFNRREWQFTQKKLPGPDGKLVDNSTFIPGYKPRYYVLNEGNPVVIFTDNGNVYWDDANQTWVGKEHGDKMTDFTVIDTEPDAIISTLNPGEPWVTAEQLKQFWIEDENQRKAGDPFTVDSLLYTDSAVFTLARKRSKLEGQLTINGAMVARDCGVLVGGHLELNYDARIRDLLQIYDTTRVRLVHTLTVRR